MRTTLMRDVRTQARRDLFFPHTKVITDQHPAHGSRRVASCIVEHPSVSTGIVSGRSESRRPEAPLEMPLGLVQVPAPRTAHGPPAVALSMPMPARMGPQA